MDYNRPLYLPWDSEFLGFPTYRLAAHDLSADALPALLNAIRTQGGKLVYLFAELADTRTAAAAQMLGLPLVDRKITYAMPATVPLEALHVTALAVAPDPTPALERLALQSGEFSRFRLDPRFAPHVYEELYRRWLRNSFGQGMASTVLTALDPTQPTTTPLGLLTLGVKGQRADIGLLAVDEAARGRRLGQQLVLAARHLTVCWGLPELQVVTQQDNAPACAFYERCGFRPDRVEHIYHVWLSA